MGPESKTILFSPMEWGLGHTVRLVPEIRKAIREGHRVILASDGLSLNFLRNSFPSLEWVRLPFYPVRYPAGNRFFRTLLPQVPGILLAIRRNHMQVRRLVREFGITDIICDHRYGMHHRNVRSVFITNQLWLMPPGGLRFFGGIVWSLHRMALKRFTEIWIADFSGEPSLSGILTHPPRLPQNAKYIGPVSRFRDIIPAAPPDAGPVRLLGLVSGPEPQRTIYESLLAERFSKAGVPSVILRGLPPEVPGAIPEQHRIGPVLIIDHASDEHLAWYILHAEEIICRPGNSTLSDLIHFGRSALLVPTPGQTEQEYVSQHLADQGRFRVCRQQDLPACP